MKWISTILFIVFVGFIILIITDNQGNGGLDWKSLFDFAFAALFGTLSFLFWFSEYKVTKNKIALLFMVLPFILVGLILVLYFKR